MDPLDALALATQAINFADALLNAFIKTQATVEAADIQVGAAHLAAMQQVSAALSAKVHAQLEAITAKGAAS